MIKLVIFDFDGVISNEIIQFDNDGNPIKNYNVKDGMGIKLLQKNGYKVGVISNYIENNSQESILIHLKVDKYYIGSENKLNILNQWCKVYNIQLYEIAYMGDDLNDLDVMRNVFLCGSPKNAINECKNISDFISEYEGGNGAVRSFCEFILNKEKKEDDEEDFLLKEISNDFQYQIKNFDMEKVNEIKNLIEKCKGTVYTSGVGKSGNLAKHFSSLIRCVSIKTEFLNPTNCLHGDIGSLNENDMILLFSKSGTTRELCELIPHLLEKNVYIIGVCCHKNSIFSEQCNNVIVTPFKSEISGEIDMIPTSSFMSQLLFTNIITSKLKKNITINDYKKNHPQGSIGKKLNELFSNKTS